MDQSERRAALTVPELDGRFLFAETQVGRSRAFRRFAAAGPTALVFAGIGATVTWAAFLGWCLFSVVRWMLA